MLPPTTLEMAFMFVPAENVFYELIGRPEILTYGRDRHVVLVSPNTMYAYIQVLAVGFRGMKIHDEARRVQEILADLGTRVGKFQDHFNMIGKHLENAKSQFRHRALRDVQRFEATLDGVKIGAVGGRSSNRSSLIPHGSWTMICDTPRKRSSFFSEATMKILVALTAIVLELRCIRPRGSHDRDRRAGGQSVLHQGQGQHHQRTQGHGRNVRAGLREEGPAGRARHPTGEVYDVKGELAADMNAKLVPHMSHTVALTGEVTDEKGVKTIATTGYLAEDDSK